MKTYNKAELATMKPAYLAWLPGYWRECEQYDWADDITQGHGYAEWDEVDELIIDDDRTITVRLFNCDPHTRDIIQPYGDETFIRSGDLEWTGDDVDYFDPIIVYFAMLHDIT